MQWRISCEVQCIWVEPLGGWGKVWGKVWVQISFRGEIRGELVTVFLVLLSSEATSMFSFAHSWLNCEEQYFHLCLIRSEALGI